MEFATFSQSDLEKINQRTIERLRAQDAHLAALTGQSHVAPDPGGSTSTDPFDDFIANSKHAKFTRNEIRDAFIVAMKKLSEQA